MGDASTFITTLKSIAIGRGIIGTVGKPHNVSAAVQLGSRKFQRNSNAGSVNPTLPITLIRFYRANLNVGNNVAGTFTKDSNDSTILDDTNYALFGVSVEANKQYKFDLTSVTGDADLFVGLRDVGLTSDNLLSIADWSYGNGASISSIVTEYSVSSGTLDNVSFTTTTAGFFDVLILSYSKGDWSFTVRTNV
jgi:hypothetical protein